MICESILLPVLGYFYCPNYELLFTCKLQVTVYFTSYELLFIYKLRVTFIAVVSSYCLLCELRITVYCTSYEIVFFHTSNELLFITRVASYISYTSYNL